MIILETKRFRARIGHGDDALAAAMTLRARAFAADRAGPDPFDERAAHLLIEERATGHVAATLRMRVFREGDDVREGYTGQFYDLAGLARQRGPFIEIGRFCAGHEPADAEMLRVVWGAIARRVDALGATLLFGCASFPSTDARRHADTLGLLGQRYRAPERWRPGRGPGETVPLPDGPVDAAAGLARMPPLLRSYLALGGRTSDHAVIDRAMGTLHVFIGVEIASISPARARVLRALGAGDPADAPALR